MRDIGADKAARQGAPTQTAERDPKASAAAAEAMRPAGTPGSEVAKPDDAPDIEHPNVISIVRRGQVEIRELQVPLPAHMQYVVNKALQPTSEGYDFLNRYKGVQFVRPDWVVDEEGKRVRNPIHRSDYVYLTLFGIWYNDIGQLVSYREDVELDFQLLYRSKIVNARSYVIDFVIDPETKKPKADAQGFPETTFTIEKHDVLKAQRELFRLRQFGIRAAHTVAKVRIMKTALGIKGLPWRAGDPASSEEDIWNDGSKHGWIPRPHIVRIPIVGFRDALTPDERWAQVKAEAEGMYAKPKPSAADAKVAESTRAAEELADDTVSGDVEALAFDADEVGRTFGETPPPDADTGVPAEKPTPKINW